LDRRLDASSRFEILLAVRPLVWIGTSREDLRGCPADVQDAIGFALYFAQLGDKHPRAKPLRGFGGAGVLEIIEDHAGDTYRAVYTVKLRQAVYVLHVFQKKAKSGIATPKRELDLIRRRLAEARGIDVESARSGEGGGR
jgi:phage-related protein